MRDTTNPSMIALSDERHRRRKSDKSPDWRTILAVLGALGIGGSGVATVINTPWVTKSEAKEQRDEDTKAAEKQQEAAKAAFAEHRAEEAKAHADLKDAIGEANADIKEILRELRGRRR